MDVLAFIRIGVLVNSALYLAGCFVAGLIVGQPVAWKAALATAGIAYLAYMAQELGESRGAWLFAVALVLLSIVTGAVAGLSLLFV